MMNTATKIIKELKLLLVANFGDDIRDVVLFGSQVTGKAHKNSDYDVLIILNRDYPQVYKRKIISVIYDIELKYEIFIDTKIISLNELHHTIKGKHPLYSDALEAGVHV